MIFLYLFDIHQKIENIYIRDILNLTINKSIICQISMDCAQETKFPLVFVKTMNFVANFMKWLREMNPLVFFCTGKHIVEVIEHLAIPSKALVANQLYQQYQSLKHETLFKILKFEAQKKLDSITTTMLNEMVDFNFSDDLTPDCWKDEIISLFKEDINEKNVELLRKMFDINIYNGRMLYNMLCNSKKDNVDHNNGHEKPDETIHKIFARFESNDMFQELQKKQVNFIEIFRMINKKLPKIDEVIIAELDKHFKCQDLNSSEKIKLPAYLVHNKIEVERKFSIVSNSLFTDRFLMMFQKNGFVFEDLLDLTERNAHRVFRADIAKELSVITLLNKKYHELFRTIMGVLREYYNLSRSNGVAKHHVTCDRGHFISNDIVAQRLLQYQLNSDKYYECSSNDVNLSNFLFMFENDETTCGKEEIKFEGCPECAGKTICPGKVADGKFLKQDTYFSCAECTTITYLMFDYRGRYAKCKRCIF
uniref:Uncharacterized protein n=1 Tax=viral metagenome TaxID=1070528 RepID=A0A6C0C8X0_9ZZZZ